MTKGLDTLHFWYDASGMPTMVTYNDTHYYYQHNLQGDIIGIMDMTGSTVVSYVYDSWGKQISCTGSLASTLGAANPLRYRGYILDEETGMYYLQSRYYNPEWGRFINGDAMIGVNGDMLAYNIFLYCSNSPLNAADPSGHVQMYETEVGGRESEYVLSPEEIALISNNTALAKAIYDMEQALSSKTLYGGTSLIYTANKYLWFYSQVKKDGPMDYKSEASWKGALSIPYPGEETGSRLGNVNYGAVGTAAGINQGTLLYMAGVFQLVNHEGYSLTGAMKEASIRGPVGWYGDQEDDYRDILQGINMYNAGTLGGK